MTTLKVLVLEGDGIGPEVTKPAVEVLQRMAQRGGFSVNLEHAEFGGASIDAHGTPVTQATLDLAKASDAVLLGAVGGPKWDELPTDQRPEKGLLALRQHLEVFANLRPARLFPALADASPLKRERANDFDFIVIRELVGGIYFGKPRGVEGAPGQRKGFNTLVYTESEIRRIGQVGFETARRRKKRLVSVDKANVLEVMGLWRSVMNELAKAYPDVELSHLYVDNCAMQLILNPSHYDVLVTGNMFGDILSDLAAAATGSIGLLPSASLGVGAGLYEPVHGSAPDIAGQGKANPLAAILSVGMLLEHTLKRPDLAQQVHAAVDKVLAQGYRTGDLGPGPKPVGTQGMRDAVIAALGE
jgi:3-isopropylmalate dehydrogenase